MKPLILPLVFLLAASLGFAEDKDPYHTFHDDRGRAIRAVLVRTGPDEVWIRREDGRTFRVAISIFSKQDQAYIIEWKRTTALSAPDAFEFSARRFSDGRETETTDYRETTVEQFGYIVTLTNCTMIDLEDLEVEYRCFAHRGAVGEIGQNRDLERRPGRAFIEELPAQTEHEFKTETLPLTSITLRPGLVFGSRDLPNSNQRRIEDDLAGVWIRVKQHHQIIAEFSTPSDLMKTEPW